MKRYCIFLVGGMMAFTSAFAQYYAVDKGVVTVAGEISYASAGGDLHESAGERAKTMNLNPSLGYFFLPNICLGIEGLYHSTSQGDYKVSVMGGGPYATFYLGGEYSQLFPFVSASLNLISGKIESGNGEYTDRQINIKLSVGATIMAAKNVGFTGKVYYLMENYKPESADKAIEGNQIGLSLGVSAFLF